MLKNYSYTLANKDNHAESKGGLVRRTSKSRAVYAIEQEIEIEKALSGKRWELTEIRQLS